MSGNFFGSCFGFSRSAEQQGDAPQTGKTDHCVDNAADARGLAAEDPRDQVEPRKADQTPVDCADNGQNQCQGIHDHSSFYERIHSMHGMAAAYSANRTEMQEIEIAFLAKSCIINIACKIFRRYDNF